MWKLNLDTDYWEYFDDDKPYPESFISLKFLCKNNFKIIND